MIFKITHKHTLLNDFFGVETNLNQNELEKLLFYVESIHMQHMPNLPYVLDDTLSEKDIIELLPILYKDKSFTFRPLYQEPVESFITIDLWDIENSHQKFEPILSEINEKYAVQNATLSLMKFYAMEVKAVSKKDYVLNNVQYGSIDEAAKKYTREADILQKILDGQEVQAEWNLNSFLGKKLTGQKFISTSDNEVLV